MCVCVCVCVCVFVYIIYHMYVFMCVCMYASMYACISRSLSGREGTTPGNEGGVVEVEKVLPMVGWEMLPRREVGWSEEGSGRKGGRGGGGG